jgi:hypothetical protein
MINASGALALGSLARVLDHGEHAIALTASDGEFERSASVKVTVEADIQPADDKVLSTG